MNLNLAGSTFISKSSYEDKKYHFQAELKNESLEDQPKFINIDQVAKNLNSYRLPKLQITQGIKTPNIGDYSNDLQNNTEKAI